MKLIQVSNGSSGVEQLLGRAIVQHNTRILVMKSITYWPIDTIDPVGELCHSAFCWWQYIMLQRALSTAVGQEHSL